MASRHRVLIKLSGEALSSAAACIDPAILDRFAGEIRAAHKKGLQIGVVVGGGNILRGAGQKESDRVTADSMGMLATAINGMAIAERLTHLGFKACVMSAVAIGTFVDAFNRQRALEKLNSGHVVIFVGGTGNPFFTTDTAAALRAAEIGADVLLKATKVDGVYDKDPMRHADAKKYATISYHEVMNKGLKVMDAAAIALCEENSIPLRVFNFNEPGQLQKILAGKNLGTIIGR